MSVRVEKIDYQNPEQARLLVELLNAYATDPMGGSCALAQTTQDNLATELAKLPHAFSLIAYVDDKPAGLANCFMGFSTFKCKPLVNIHDLAVLPEFRGSGLGRALLAGVESIARERDCCKVTLEVLEGNTVAQHAYRNYGFAGYELDDETGKALFWEKPLS